MTRNQLLARALGVRDETEDEANDALRVGQLLYDIIFRMLIGYDPGSTYGLGEYAFFNGVIYRATGPVGLNQSPEANPMLWSDDVARRAEQIDPGAPDRLVSQRAVAQYVADQLVDLQPGGQTDVPDASETVKGLVRRSSRKNATRTNTTDYVSPAMLLDLMANVIDGVTLDQAARAGNDTATELLTNGGIGAESWETTDTADRIFVAKLVDGILRLALIDKAKLLKTPVDPDPDPDPDPITLRWRVGDLYEEVLIPVADTLRWRVGDLYEEVTATAPQPPLPPTNVRADRVSNTRDAVVSWTDTASNETGFDIEQSLDNVTFSGLLSVNANVTVLPLGGLLLNQTYYYRVRSKNSAGVSVWVNSPVFRLTDLQFTFFLHGQGSPPPVVRQLLSNNTAASPGMGNLAVRIFRPDGSAVQAGDFDGMTFQVTEPGGAKRGWSSPEAIVTSEAVFAYLRPDGGALAAGTYQLTAALYRNGQVMQQATISVTMTPAPRQPEAPTAATVTRNAAQNGFVLRYTDNADNEDSFTIDWQKPGEARTYYGSVLANQTEFSSLVSPLPDGTKFFVASKNEAGTSDYAEITLTTVAPPPTPTGLTIYSVDTAISLIWNAQQPGLWPGSTYVERATGNGVFARLTTTPAGSNTYTDSTTTAGVSYQYRTQAVNLTTGQTSSYSNTVTGTRNGN